MISIVVCSVNNDYFEALSANIAATIGTPYELIRIDNKNKTYSICQAYNKGKLMAQYEVICFAHEDIQFYSNDWGAHLVEILKDKTIGLVGVLGACYLSLFPPDWIDPDEVEGQIIEGYKPGHPEIRFKRFPAAELAEVASVDGVFMVTRKEIIGQIDFSEKILDGFHGYDFDLSMQIRQQYKVVITRNLLLKHASKGNFDTSFYKAVRRLYCKWNRKLPVYVQAYSPDELKKLKLKSLQQFWSNAKGKKSLVERSLRSFVYAARHQVLLSWVRTLLGYRTQY